MFTKKSALKCETSNFHGFGDDHVENTGRFIRIYLVTSMNRSDGGKIVPFDQHDFNLRNGSTYFFQYEFHCLLINDNKKESRMGQSRKMNTQKVPVLFQRKSWCLQVLIQ
ncbi:hypothetical protein quinque_005718 [Culex quinquefasciatus]